MSTGWIVVIVLTVVLAADWSLYIFSANVRKEESGAG